MSELRLILLAVGVVVIAAIYWFTRREKRASGPRGERREPSFETFVSDSDAVPATRAADYSDAEPAGETADVAGLAEAPVSAAQASSAPATPETTTTEPFQQADLPLPEELRPEPAGQGDDATAASSAEQKEMVIVINVSAKGGKRFGGPEIVDALRAEQLELGELDIFHRRSGGRSMFSAASMVEPGTFDLSTIDRFSTPGISLFLVLPGPDSPVAAFTEMLSVARRLATTLGGEVLDESGSTLSRQAASHLREQIINFAHRIR